MDNDQHIEACARAAHEANRAYCLALGDTSQLSWDEAPDWQRSSAIIGAGRIVFSIMNPAYRGCPDSPEPCSHRAITPEGLHESWCEEKLATGWKYGPVKDPDKKEHPCLIPYAELPLDQRAKDALFLAVVRAVHAALSWTVLMDEARLETEQLRAERLHEDEAL